MLSLDEIIAEAENTERESADIEVIFNSGISRDLEKLRLEEAELLDQLDTIEQDLTTELEILKKDRRASDPRPTAAQQRAEQAKADIDAQIEALAPRIAEVEARAADFLVTFRITALHGFEWEEITARSMPRDGNAEDASRNYNVDDVTRIVASRSAVRIGPDGGVIDITSEQWAGIWKTLPPLGRRQFKQSIYVLNEYATVLAQNQAVDAARKVSTAQQAATQPSRSASGSTLADSTGGNPQSSSTTDTTTKAA